MVHSRMRGSCGAGTEIGPLNSVRMMYLYTKEQEDLFKHRSRNSKPLDLQPSMINAGHLDKHDLAYA